MTLYKLFFKTTSQAAPIFGDVLEEDVLAVSWYEIDEATDTWAFDCTFNDINDGDPLRHLVSETALRRGLRLSGMTVMELPETDWLEQTWKNFPPRQIGQFFIYGSHNKVTIPEGLIGLEINAATAFGSGEHETTTACIQALSQLKADGLQVRTPLDMGCGSGILAMVMAKLWGTPVLAVDNDPESVRVTLTNARKNNCAMGIMALCNDGFSGAAVKDKGPFDLVTANILAAPLQAMAPDMAACVAPQGRIVLSGLLTRQIEEIRQTYEGVGFTFLEPHILGDWAALVFEKCL
jgi:ribosomal protein L11 methyltransferase